MKRISRSAFVSALKAVPRPSANVQKFLAIHYDAPGRAATATLLAKAAGYQGYRGVNLQYGRLAKQIGAALGLQDPGITTLVDCIGRRAVTNKDWLLIMHPEFAEALKLAGWVKSRRR